MVSKINIGPENGPYVAINEENGNLQLEDNSGNVVAEWDETNAQWDFADNTLANVDALNSNLVNTEESRITGGAGVLLKFRDPDTGEIAEENFDTIQGAVNAADANDLVGGSGENESEAVVEILGGDPFDEAVAYPDTASSFTVRGFGEQAAARISYDGSDHAVDMRDNDAYLCRMWIDHTGTGSYDAVHSTTRESRIRNVGVDAAPRHGIFVTGREAIVTNCEIQGGDDNAFYCSSTGGSISNLQIKGVPNTGVNFIDADEAMASNISVDNPTSLGVFLDSDRMTLDANINDAGTDGLRLRGADNNIRCAIWGAADDALDIGGTGATGNVIVVNTDGSIVLDSDTSDNVLMGKCDGLTDNGTDNDTSGVVDLSE